MAEVLILFLAACGTALATGLGAIPVFFLGTRAAQLTPVLLGFAAGVMGVASVAGLLVLACAAPATAGPREQARRMHDRLVGVPPTEAVLGSMAAKIAANMAAAAARTRSRRRRIAARPTGQSCVRTVPSARR